MWLVLFIVLLVLLSHVADLRIQDKVLAVIVQKTPVGQVETWVNTLQNSTKHDIFAHRRDFYAELVFTEKAIIIFRMFKLGPIKLRTSMMVLAKGFDDVPLIDDFWYRMQAAMLYKLDSILIDGRRVLFECTYTMPQGYQFNRFIRLRYRKFLISDLRDNDAYKNVLLLNRHLQQK